jgi:hypothetical protein
MTNSDRENITPRLLMWIKSTKVSNFLSYAEAEMADETGITSTKKVFCPCGNSFPNAGTYLGHKRLCANHQNMESIISTNPSSNRKTATAPPAARASILASTSDKILCPCGQSFTTEKKLEKHLRYSKTHQTGKPRTGSTPRGTIAVSVPITAPHSSPTPISLALGLVPPTISSPVTSIVPYTYAQAFETQRVLDLQKRDSLYHRRQGDRLLTQNQEDDNTLVSSFASLNLESVSSQARPLVARFSCVCGRTFICQEALTKHKQDERRREKGERRDKMFMTPRPQYQEDEGLHAMVALLARQQYSEL